MHVALCIDWLEREIKALIVTTDPIKAEEQARIFTNIYMGKFFEEEVERDETGVYAERVGYEHSVFLVDLNEQASAVLL